MILFPGLLGSIASKISSLFYVQEGLFLNLEANTSSVDISATNDPYYNNVSLMLHGDGKNDQVYFRDDSLNQFVITQNGNTKLSTTQKMFGSSSMYFDGVEDYITIPDNESFEVGSGDYTLEFWFYATAEQDGTFFMKGKYFPFNVWEGGFGIRRLNSNLIRFYFNTTDNFTTEKTYDYTTTTNLNTWYHVAMVVSGGVGYAFLDGNLLNSGGYSGVGSVPNSSHPAIIGKFPFDAVSLCFAGYIDDLRLTKGVVRYTGSFSVPSSPYSSRINLWTDSTQNGNNATLLNGITYSSLNQGKLIFDGVNDYLQIENSSSLNQTSGTISFWFQYDSITIPAGDAIISKADAISSFNGYTFYLYNNGVYVTIKDASSGVINVGSSAPLVSGSWYNISFTYNAGNNYKLFLNNSLISSGSLGNFTISSQPLRIGRSVDTYWGNFKGSISDLKMYNRILSDSEVSQNFNAVKSRYGL